MYFFCMCVSPKTLKVMSQKTPPFVTVIMPIRNEADFIERSLGAVLNQNYLQEKLEVIVVDGLSDDGTREILQEFLDSDANLQVLDNPERIVPTGMNEAIRQAKGTIIVRVDGHTIIEPDYVAQCVDALFQSGAANVGGLMRAVGEGYVPMAIVIATSTPYGVGNSVFHYSAKEQFVDTVYMGCFQKDVLFRVGLYNERFVRHQDYELNYRIRKSGEKILLSPKIQSQYYVRSSIKALWKQYWQYGIWKGRFLRAHPDSLRMRHLVPPVFVMTAVVTFLLSLIFSSFFMLFFGIIGLYLLFVLLASLKLSYHHGMRFFLILPIIFFVLHISWGTGVWLGLLSFKKV